jgi:5-methylcytosine-specific restriction endonuclease McrA
MYGYCAQHKKQTGYLKGSKINYRGYINHPNWSKMSKKIRAGKKCVLCGGSADHAHHNNYVNLGRETRKDLAPLCVNCHNMFHKFHETRAGRFVALRQFKREE